jgi:hypothetical protein
MPTRLLREGILKSEPVDSLSEPEELFYRRLMSVVDDFGRIEADARILRAECYPLRVDRVTLQQIEAWVAAVEAAQLIATYEVDGKRYLEYLKLGKPRATKSRFPDPKLQVKTPVNGCIQVKTDVPYSNSDSDASSYSVSNAGAAAAPRTPALSVEEWNQPDPEQLAQQLASELVPRHWFPSDMRLVVGALIRVFATAVNLTVIIASIRTSHGLWVERVEQARQSGSLPRTIANKALEWWIKDEFYLQDPKFGASRLEQVASRGGVGRTVARLLSSGE